MHERQLVNESGTKKTARVQNEFYTMRKILRQLMYTDVRKQIRVTHNDFKIASAFNMNNVAYVKGNYV